MSLDKNPAGIAAMFDGVAHRYDLFNSILSLGQERYWRRRLVDAVGLRRGDKVLDLAAGTGASSEPFADAGVDVTACDISFEMLRIGKRRRPDINFVAGDAINLPFRDNVFDVVTISFGLRNVIDPELALREMKRVTKPGGKVVVAEFSKPRSRLFNGMYKMYLTRILPWVCARLTHNSAAYDYLADSIQQWQDQDTLAALMLKVGWQDVKYRNLSGGIVALHRGYKSA